MQKLMVFDMIFFDYIFIESNFFMPIGNIFYRYMSTIPKENMSENVEWRT